ncbi:hypothetical protein ACIOWI_37740 [Streptomyces sp. NPDC087659]|uniref:hypothetical protein n=1 Tax=unclassified Streptomyces TaxID=2593676 RepID=UPI0036ED6867
MQRCVPGGVHFVPIGRDTRGQAVIAAQAIEEARRITQDASEASRNPAQAGSRLGALLEQRSPTPLILDDVWERERLDPFLIGRHRCARACTPLRPEA